jgi:Molybdopterin-binding domain of aldehyde dehydrogenase
MAQPWPNIPTIIAAASSVSKPTLRSVLEVNHNRLTYSYGSAVAHVAVDPRTGDVELLACLVVEDVGRIVNPVEAILHGRHPVALTATRLTNSICRLTGAISATCWRADRKPFAWPRCAAFTADGAGIFPGGTATMADRENRPGGLRSRVRVSLSHVAIHACARAKPASFALSRKFYLQTMTRCWR